MSERTKYLLLLGALLLAAAAAWLVDPLARDGDGARDPDPVRAAEPRESSATRQGESGAAVAAASAETGESGFARATAQHRAHDLRLLADVGRRLGSTPPPEVHALLALRGGGADAATLTRAVSELRHPLVRASARAWLRAELDLPPPPASRLGAGGGSSWIRPIARR